MIIIHQLQSDDFNCFKPHTSTSCTRYPIRNPIMQHPFIKIEYARYALNGQLFRVINGNIDCFFSLKSIE